MHLKPCAFYVYCVSLHSRHTAREPQKRGSLSQGTLKEQAQKVYDFLRLLGIWFAYPPHLGAGLRSLFVQFHLFFGVETPAFRRGRKRRPFFVRRRIQKPCVIETSLHGFSRSSFSSASSGDPIRNEPAGIQRMGNSVPPTAKTCLVPAGREGASLTCRGLR